MVAWTPVQKPWTKQSQLGWQPQQQKGQIQVGGWKGASKGQQKAWQPSGSFFANKGAWQGGWQGKGGGSAWQPRKPPPAIQPSFKVDSSARYIATVDFYAKWKGYGFANLLQKGVVPNDRIFIHWKEIQSDDRYPFLTKEMEVELSIGKVQAGKGGGIWTLRAENVTMIGGINIAIQDDLDATQKTFVGGQHLRYTGNLKFYNPRRGFGYVAMDQGYDVDADVPLQLRVETAEVNSGGQPPKAMENLAVEFGIWKTPRGGYKVYNMTLPGGHPVTQDAVENRISMGAQGFRGEVTMWNWRNGFGFIRPDPSAQLPPRVVAKLAEQVAAARQRGRTITEERLLYFRRLDCIQGCNPQKGIKVAFQVYIDDKGAGAMGVSAV